MKRPPSLIARAIAKLILLVHLLCIIFIVFGFLLPLDYLTLHLYAIPLMILQWWVNNDQCVLTQIQYRLEGRKINPDDEGQFIKALLKKFGLSLERPQLFKLIYGILLVSFCLSALRLYLSY